MNNSVINENDEPITILQKNNFLFSKINSSIYKLSFSIENDNFEITKILNIDIIPLLYQLNQDIYEFSFLDKIDANHGTMTLLPRHLFKDIGIPHHHAIFSVNHYIQDNYVFFDLHAQPDNTHEILKDKKTSHAPIDTIQFICDTTNIHDIHVSVFIHIHHAIPEFFLLFIGQILIKIIERVKLFIESL